MLSEYDERVKEYWRISHGNYIVRLIDDKELEDEVKELNTMPLNHGTFIFSNSERKMNIFFMQLVDFIQTIFITEILIVYILKINIGKNQIKLVYLEKKLLHGENNFKVGGFFYGLFLAPEKILFNYQ